MYRVFKVIISALICWALFGIITIVHTQPLITLRDPALLLSASNNHQEVITVTVRWDAMKGPTTGLGFGLNAFQGFRPESFNNAVYRSNMLLMKPGLIRFHNSSALQDSSTPDGLIDTANRTWNATKVKQALAASFSTFGNQQPQRMVNIPTWPSWMDANNDGFLDANQFDHYAELCADLVKVVNQNRTKVKYWEVTNEKDDSYFTQFHDAGGWGGLKNAAEPDRLNELISIYNKAAIAMKKVDPTIQVGGPGLARSDLKPFYVPFIQGTKANLDFLTYHFYATGSAATLDREIYQAATASIKTRTASMVNALKAVSPSRSPPVILGEYNISWTWETRDPRMMNNKGVVFDALIIVNALQNGAVATLAWNEKDGTYGKMGDKNDLRLGGAFFQVLNNHLVGEQVESSSSNQGVITTFAVRSPALGCKSYLLINHSGARQQVQTRSSGSRVGKQVEQYEFSATGSTKKPMSWDELGESITLPADSVTLITFRG